MSEKSRKEKRKERKQEETRVKQGKSKKKEKLKIKDIDFKILKVMQEDLCVPQVTIIAHRVHQPTSTVHDRLKYLKKVGVIKSYSPILEPKKLGAGFLVFVLANIKDLQHPEIACNEIAKFPFVLGAYFLIGKDDILIKMRSKDIDQHMENMKKIRKYVVGGGGIVVSKVFKDTNKFPIQEP